MHVEEKILKEVKEQTVTNAGLLLINLLYILADTV